MVGCDAARVPWYLQEMLGMAPNPKARFSRVGIEMSGLYKIGRFSRIPARIWLKNGIEVLWDDTNIKQDRKKKWSVKVYFFS